MKTQKRTEKIGIKREMWKEGNLLLIEDREGKTLCKMLHLVKFKKINF